MSEAERWLLGFSSKRYWWSGPLRHGGGRPWADGSMIAAREGLADPWDEGCKVTPMLGGYKAMSAMRNAFERAIDFARGLPPDIPPAERGHVYLSFWRFSPQRDLSEANSWGLHPWHRAKSPSRDQSALGLILRMMEVGIEVRMLLWYPEVATDFIVGNAHMEEHAYTARVVQAWSDELRRRFPQARRPLGIVGLDLRVAETIRPAAQQQAQVHHKLAVIRVGDIAVAHCGGADLSFTRRDAPMMHGDWQSGLEIPEPQDRWPGWRRYAPLRDLDPPRIGHSGDLPVEVYGEDRQIWHDHHVQVEGPAVAVLEERFRQQWAGHGTVRTLDVSQALPSWPAGYVAFSSPQAHSDGAIVPLDPVGPVAAAGRSAVQIWSTVPWCAGRSGSSSTRGEYTVMSGIAHACQQSNELIWVFDQYFWNRPLARLLCRLLAEREGLRIIIVLPPHAGGGNLSNAAARTVHRVHHLARNLALSDLTRGQDEALRDRVAVYSLWHPSTGRGVYCHAKSQTYDGNLLVCGSANLSRRSFTRDVETMVAVVDTEMVHAHQRELWDWLFCGAPWPTDSDGREVRLDRPGGGAQFFDAFRAQVSRSDTFLIPDHWADPECLLPNGVLRRNDGADLSDTARLLDLTDPDALAVPQVETPYGDHEAPRLDQIVELLEAGYSIRRMGPRHPSSG